jgi:hypothetical protein
LICEIYRHLALIIKDNLKYREKTTKTIKMSDEKKGKNIMTDATGLVFNVNTFRTGTVSWFEAQGVDPVPKQMKSYVCVASVIEKLARYIIDKAISGLKAGKDDMKEITLDVLRDTIKDNKVLLQYFLPYIYDFNESMVYIELLNVNDADYEELMDNYHHVTMSKLGKNFMCFLLQTVQNDINKKVRVLISYSKKVSLSEKEVTAAIQIMFNQPIQSIFTDEIERVVQLVKEVNEEKKKKKDKKGGKKKKDKKGGKKKKDESDDESDAESDAESESESESEAESDAESEDEDDKKKKDKKKDSKKKDTKKKDTKKKGKK